MKVRLYTPQCLIRKLKIYLTAGSKRNYKVGALKKVTTRQRRDISCDYEQDLSLRIGNLNRGYLRCTLSLAHFVMSIRVGSLWIS